MPVQSVPSRKRRRSLCRGERRPPPQLALESNTPPQKPARALHRQPTKPFLISAISIWTTSVMSLMFFCNKPPLTLVVSGPVPAAPHPRVIPKTARHWHAFHLQCYAQSRNQ